VAALALLMDRALEKTLRAANSQLSTPFAWKPWRPSVPSKSNPVSNAANPVLPAETSLPLKYFVFSALLNSIRPLLRRIKNASCSDQLQRSLQSFQPLKRNHGKHALLQRSGATWPRKHPKRSHAIFLSQILARFSQVSTFPFSDALHPSLAPDLREIYHRKYAIYYLPHTHEINW
jgi:hypothetical protein